MKTTKEYLEGLDSETAMAVKSVMVNNHLGISVKTSDSGCTPQNCTGSTGCTPQTPTQR